ncbi:SurA N-terminal domain-containing protein [Candidatus Woesearchaeota archaeon]|nr:SurA N-terminal domain-containing protein [Candidatus Woesearchaeota archaeon]
MKKAGCKGTKDTMATSSIICLVLIIMVLAALIVGCARGKIGPEEKGREVAAIVNGARIYFSDVNEEYASLAPEQKANVTKADALSFLIEREILYQQALKEGFRATAEEVESEYLVFAALSNLTEAELKSQLAARNSSVEKLKSVLLKQVLIIKLLDKKVPRQFVIRHEDVEAVYNASFRQTGLSFEQSENAIVELLSAQRQKAGRERYIESLKEMADVLIVAVPS